MDNAYADLWDVLLDWAIDHQSQVRRPTTFAHNAATMIYQELLNLVPSGEPTDAK